MVKENVINGFRKEELPSRGNKTGNNSWWNAREIENKENFEQSLYSGSIKQSIYWIRVPGK